MPVPAARPSRVVPAVLVLVTVLAGLGGRALLPATVGGPWGDVLYAVLLVGLVALVAPRTAPATAAAVALGAATLVEASHLTPLPGPLLDRVPAVRYVLGTSFGVTDLACYVVGAALGGALLAALRPRRATVDDSLRHVRARAGSAGGRRVARVAVPLALLAVAGTAVLGTTLTLQDEARDLATRIHTASAELEASDGRVTAEAVRTELAAALDDAATVRAATPLLDRRPGDAVAAGDRLDAAVAAVRDSRRELATTEATTVRATLDAPRRRATRVLTATDELAATGQDAGAAARDGLRRALGEAEDLVATTGPDRLRAMPLTELEGVAPALTARHDDLDRSTTDVMVAQDAVVCPEEDQRWNPAGGRLDADDLAVLPWSPSHRVRADVLDGLVALDDAYRAEFGEHLTVNSAYRSFADQVAVFRPENPNPLAAPPGCSNHGLGTAVDLGMGPDGFDGARFAWMTEHAERYGWVHPDWAGPDGRLPEPWHWESVRTPRPF